MKFIDEKGNTIKIATINGYHFGDRLLDGVRFECVVKDEKIVVIGVVSSAEKYFKQLNTKLWMKIAQSYVDNSIEEDDYEIFDKVLVL